ncbi:MAG: alpha-amylase family glycosyl hydrolase, partial [Terriglobales bacterium]
PRAARPAFLPQAAGARAAATGISRAGGATAPPAQRRDRRAWWRHAVIYEIYARSFKDSNGDGIGDLNGIREKLGFLRWLGVDAIWLTPIYPSGGVDGGYDIIHYRQIDPVYGTMADFERLVAAARRDHIRVFMDLVLAHTSNQDPWFLHSRRSRQGRFANYYIWRDGHDGGPPNNWTSLFGGSAWQYDPLRRQYYYHYYYRQQPDLNWRDPAVRRAMFARARFWLRKGVAGFRLDSVGTMLVDPEFRNNPPGTMRTGDFPLPQQHHVHNYNLPGVHAILAALRRTVAPYGGILIGETVGKTAAQLATFYGTPRQPEIQLPFDFLFADVNRLSAPAFRRQIAAWEHNPAHGTPVWFFDNHDQPRELRRYGNGKDNRKVARLLPTLLLTLRGTVILYYGQPIGMTTTPPTSRAAVVDPMGRRFWPVFKGRDGERTPMQWTAGPEAGFSPPGSHARPWLPIPASYKTVNVASERADPNSLLNYYRKLIALKRHDPALRRGAWISVHNNDALVLSYLRRWRGEMVLVALNMSGQRQTEAYHLGAAQATVLADSLGTEPPRLNLNDVVLPPYEGVVARVQPGGRAGR